MSLIFGSICAVEQFLILVLICKSCSKKKEVKKYRNDTSVWHHTKNYQMMLIKIILGFLIL